MTIVLQRITDLVKGTRETLATLRFQQHDAKTYIIQETPIQLPSGEFLRLSALYDSARRKLSLGIVSREYQVLRLLVDWVGSTEACLFRFGSDSFELYLEKDPRIELHYMANDAGKRASQDSNEGRLPSR